MERQIRFLEEVEKKLPKNKSFTKELSFRLGLSESYIRKKLKGTSKLSLHDLVLLSNHYGVSIDQFFNPVLYEKRIDYFSIDISSAEQYKSYIIKLRDDLLREASAKEVWKICSDVPPPLAMYRYPEASVFLFYLDMMKKKKEEFVFEEFVGELERNGVFDVYREIYSHYIDKDSIEIYSVEAISYLPKAVGKLGSTPLFAEADTPILILEQLQKMLLQMKDWIKRKRKKGGSYQLYLSQKSVGSNIILCQAEEGVRICLSARKGHGMETLKDFNYLEATRGFLDDLRQMYTCMCFIGEVQRDRIFNDFFVSIEEIKYKINPNNV